jgi:hypothetical protein
MMFLSIFAFCKQFILINDSLIIMSIMGLLLTLIIKNGTKMLKTNFEETRESTQKDLQNIVSSMLKNANNYRNKLELIIEYNFNRGFLIPNVSKDLEETQNPEENIKEIYFQY